MTKSQPQSPCGRCGNEIRCSTVMKKDRLAKITHNGFDYAFTYDGFGNRKSVKTPGRKRSAIHTVTGTVSC